MTTDVSLAQQRRERRLTWLIIGLFSLAVVIMALWTFLLNRPQSRVTFQPRQMSQEREDEFVSQARELRSVWEKWALAHKDVLIAMRQSNGDAAACERTWNELPSEPMNIGFAFDALNKSGRWSWQPFIKVQDKQPPHPDPETAALMAKGKRAEIAYRTRVFAQEHDLALSESGGSTPSSIRLWASGRITRQTPIMQQIPGKPVFADDDKEDEIVPHFDFLP